MPVAALVDFVVVGLNHGKAVWEMSPAGTALDRDLLGLFKRVLIYPAAPEGSTVPVELSPTSRRC
ncbi:MAG TPA: hypothetical protein VFZ08_04270 [Terriglobia bacterium]|nr:hypothetical protein [Terriglobia bacterium]